MTRFLSGRFALFLCCVVLSNATATGAEPSVKSQQDFSHIGKAVLQLLETGDAAEFAKSVTPTLDDWRGIAKTNATQAEIKSVGSDLERMLERQKRQNETAAKQVIAKITQLNVSFTNATLTATTKVASIGTTRYPNFQAEGESLQFADELQVIVAAAPKGDGKNGNAIGGEYILTVPSLLKFPAGWRAVDGLRWTSFPSNVADSKVQLEMLLLSRAAAHEPITDKDDPALMELGKTLASFVRSADMKTYEARATPSVDAIWSMFRSVSESTGRDVPTRDELEKQWAKQRTTMIEPAEAMVALMTSQGIDLKDADIAVEKVELKRLRTPDSGTVEGLSGSQLSVTLSAITKQKAKTGKGLAGQYVVSAGDTLRIGGRWFIGGPIRWTAFPDGVVDDETAAQLKFDTYVAEKGTLPPGTEAPDIEFVRINGGQKERLRDLKGRFVILEFWATWCGPCQEPMAKMQTYQEENPKWKDKVAVLALSIDDEVDTARGHLEKKGWNKTHNVWAGEGGWQSAPARAFRVRGVPTCYVIDPDGKIVKAGHPISLRAPEVVNASLK